MIWGSYLTLLSGPATPLPPPARKTMLFWVMPALFELLWLLCLLLLLRFTAFLSLAPTEYPLTFYGDCYLKLNKIGPFPFCCAAVVVIFPIYFGAPLGWPYLKKESVFVFSFNYLASFCCAMYNLWWWRLPWLAPALKSEGRWSLMFICYVIFLKPGPNL